MHADRMKLVEDRFLLGRREAVVAMGQKALAEKREFYNSVRNIKARQDQRGLLLDDGLAKLAVTQKALEGKESAVEDLEVAADHRDQEQTGPERKWDAGQIHD